MTSKTSTAIRSLSGFALATACGSALLLGTLSPAAATQNGMSKNKWSANVSRQLSAHIREMKTVPEGLLAGRAAVVAAHFDADGKFLKSTLERGTGNTMLDREALRAASSIHYPALPAAMRGTSRAVAMEVFFTDPDTNPAAAEIHAASKQAIAKYTRNKAEPVVAAHR